MEKISFLIILICSLTANAQNYFISYTGTGGSTTVETVVVENLSSGLTVSMNGGDVLHLTGTVGILPVVNKQSMGLKIYPNPMNAYSTIAIYPPVTGDAVISIYDMTGKQLFKDQCYLENNLQDLRISGINRGLFLISIKGKTYQYTGKLSCYAKSGGIIKIEKVSGVAQSIGSRKSEVDNKGSMNTVEMAYTDADRLKITGKSGIYRTVVIDIPASDKTITFEFIPCTDGNNFNYSTIKIGDQIWMAENLRATKYKNGDIAIPLVTDPIVWRNLTTDAFCYYNNDPSTFGNTYGALYNWNAVNTGNLCPVGWRVGTDADWTKLVSYLGGQNAASVKLRESGTLHWAPPNTAADNRTGFSALPGGYRHSTFGTFITATYRASFWSSTQYNSLTAWCRELYSDNNVISQNPYDKKAGYSIRCIKE
jgi:uncharacterized protein (TIGR02145 family)